MKFKLLATAESFFDWLAHWAEAMRERVAFCPDCGRNRYDGPPCKVWK
jgi:hypothetical protein